MAVTTFYTQLPPHGPAKPPAPPVQAGKVRRTELGTFLRSRRERLSPEEVGLPPSLRRRTPGLRREEVAQLAGVGVTWYTWLEQGRPINASTQVLDSIARTLRLDSDEHLHLYRLADVPSSVPKSSLIVQLEPEIQQVLDEMSSMAVVINERYDLLAWNRPYALLFPGLADYKGKYRNSVWFTFTSPGCCHPFVNRAEEMPRMVATLRAAYAHHVGEPGWEGFITDLLDNSPPFATLWANHEVGGYGSRHKIFQHPAVGRLDFNTMSLGIHATPGTRIVVYTPADEDTACAMRSLDTDASLRDMDVLECGHRFASANPRSSADSAANRN